MDQISSTLTVALAQVDQTRQVVIGEHVLDKLPQVLLDTCPGTTTAVVVADTTTWAVAGQRVNAALEKFGFSVAPAIVLPAPPSPHASAENVAHVRQSLAATEAVAVAVGSGTINDLVKRASFELDRPYVVVATACSMDGYTAFAAPITVAGFKTSLPCPAPRALVADLTVLATAPPAMTASGYGDLLGKISAGACWLVADAVGVEAVDSRVWPYLQEPFRNALANPEAIGRQEPAAVARLLEGLVLSGLTIQMYESSRPGSGMEHLLSHLWEMEGLGSKPDPPLSHGQKVGVGSVAAAALYATLLAVDMADLDVDGIVTSWPSATDIEQRVRFLIPNPVLADTAVRQSIAKHIDADQAHQRLTRIQRVWPALRRSLHSQLLPPEEIQRRLRAVAAPAHPADIGLTMTQLRRSYQAAQVIRSRYTILDLAVETGLLEPALDQLFDSSGFWGAQT